MTAHGPPDDTVEVRTWVDAAMRESVDAALRDLIPYAQVQHVVRHDELYVAFPYRSRAILVCSVPHPDGEGGGEGRRSLSLLDLLSGWDGSLLLHATPDNESGGGGRSRRFSPVSWHPDSASYPMDSSSMRGSARC